MTSAMARQATAITTPMAAAAPTSPTENALVYSRNDGVIVEVPGPPRVVSQTRSKVRSAPVTVRVSATASWGLSPGRVTAKNSRTAPAPSTRAAS